MSVRDVVQAAAGALGGDKVYVEDVFSTYLFTGTGTTTAITNGIDLAGEGGLLWIKDRDSGAKGHALFDTERGGQYKLQSQWTGAQTSYNNIVFNSDGFTNDTLGDNNGSGTKFTSWTFRKAPKFFDVVTWTGNGTTQNIAHNLGSVPGAIIVKDLTTAEDWAVYHTSLGNTKAISLNTTNAAYTSSTRWENTSPTDTQFTVGGAGTVNRNGDLYVAYLFAHDAGGFGEDGEQNVISCGSFTPSGGAATVTLGYEPQFVILKNSSASENWFTLDTMRGWVAAAGGERLLNPNLSNAESAGNIGNPTATGFETANLGTGTYIYIAIRRGPMATPTSGTEVLYADATTASTNAVTTTGFPVDLQIGKWRTSSDAGQDWSFTDRLRGLNTIGSESYVPSLRSTNTNAEASSLLGFNFTNTTYKLGSYYNGLSKVFYNLRRAPGFFEVVAYTGTGSARTVNHNLGVAPEFIIVKSRSNAVNWYVYNATIGNSSNLILNKDEGAATSSPTRTIWNNTDPTSSVFSVGPAGWNVNDSGQNYIAYLFATLAGVSKVGSYTGTAANLDVDCGFSAGARFILIKRTDGPAVAGNGDWYVWDSERGIVAGNDPYLLLNSSAAEVTSTDYIDPLASGFTVTSSAPAALNASGGTYIFLAIA